jgi:hypothetical protein
MAETGQWNLDFLLRVFLRKKPGAKAPTPTTSKPTSEK